ncbi:MAG: MaoC family dehydratase [Pseudomonadota bacterium]
MPNNVGGFYYDELEIGQAFEFERIITEDDVMKFAEVSGDNNPLHTDEAFAKTTIFGERIAHGALTASFISAALGNNLPGPGCIFVSLNLRFLRPVKIGAKVLTKISIKNKDERRNMVTCTATSSVDGKNVLAGEAFVMVPSEKA